MSWQERNEQSVEILKEWYKKQPHLPQGIQDEYFVTFVYGSKTIEIAKQKMDAYFSMRHELIWYKNFDTQLETFIKSTGGDIFFLPDTTPEGWRVIFFTLQRADYSKLNPVEELFRRMILTDLGLILFPRESSVVAVFDLSNCPASYYAKLDIPAEISVVHYATRAMPRRLKKIILVNSSHFLEKTVNIIKPFMSKKIISRLFIMQGIKDLKDHLSIKILPKEYGGEAGTIQELGDAWRKKVLDNEDWLRRNMSLCSDETKRSKESAYKCQDLGVQGSFRSLAFD